jgi:hypothetical protein
VEGTVLAEFKVLNLYLLDGTVEGEKSHLHYLVSRLRLEFGVFHIQSRSANLPLEHMFVHILL